MRLNSQEGVDSEALAVLDHVQLKELGINRMGDRAKVYVVHVRVLLHADARTTYQDISNPVIVVRRRSIPF